MIPGEFLPRPGTIELNAGRDTIRLQVANTGDRSVQVGSHYHFYEVNDALQFEREQARGMHLNIPAGNTIRFEPGDEKEVTLVAFGGQRQIYGFHDCINGPLDA